MNPKTHRFLLLPLVAAFALTPTGSTSAQSWDGGAGTGNWGTAENWEPDGIPAFNTSTDITFHSASANLTTLSTFLGAGRTIRSLAFSDDADSDVSIRTTTTSNGTTAAHLTFNGTNAAVNVASGANGNLTVGTGGGFLYLAANTTIDHNGSGTLFMGRAIGQTGGSFGITKTGTGTVRLANTSSSWGGGLVINQGTVQLNGNNTLSFGANGSAITLGGGTLHIDPQTSGFSLSTRNITTTANTTSTLTYNDTSANNYTLTIAGSGQGYVTKLNGDLLIKNTSSAGGADAISYAHNITGAGKLSFEGYNDLSANLSDRRLQMGGNNTGWSGTFEVRKGSSNFTSQNSSGSATIVLGVTDGADGAALYNGAAGAVFSNPFIVRSGSAARILRNAAAGSVNWSGGFLLEGSLAYDASATIAGTDVLSGSLTGAGSLIKTGNQTLSLTGNNTHTGGTTISAGTLVLDSQGALGTSGPISFTGGTLCFSAANTEDFSSRVSSAASQVIHINTAGQNVTFATALTSSGGSLKKSGAGTLTLSGANALDGGITLEAGTLAFASGGSLAGAVPLTLVGNATLSLPPGGSGVSFADSAALAWSGTLQIVNFAPGTLRFGTSAAGLTADQLRLIRIGNDYAMLDANGYLQRVLATAATISGDQSSIDYQIVGGGVLSGNGTIGSLAIGPHGRIAPGDTGNPTGTITIAGPFTAQTASVFQVHTTRTANGTFTRDQLTATGSVDFRGIIELFLDGTPLQAGDEIQLITGNITMLTHRALPSPVVVDQASPTPLPAGLELTTVYYPDKVTALVRTIDTSPGVQHNGGFEQGMHFWDVNSPGSGATRTFATDAANPAAGKTSLRVDVTAGGAPGPYPGDVQVYQNFNVVAGQTYNISFKMRASASRTIAWGVQNTKISRGTGFPAPAINGFINYNVNVGTTWTTVSQNWTAGAAESAVLQFMIGQFSGSVWIDDVKITGQSLETSDPFHVTAYARGGYRNDIPRDLYQHVDTLIYSFIMSDIGGNVVPYYPQVGQNEFTPAVRDFFQGLKNDFGLELLVAIGGGSTPNYANDFYETVIASPTLRTTLINNLISFCQTNGFDGLDIDYEYPEAAIEQVNYGVFVAEAKTAFATAGLKLTSAVDTYGGVYFPPQTYRDLEASHVMGYNMNSDLMTKDALELFNVGAPMSKIFPGIIYSGTPRVSGSTVRYSEIVHGTGAVPQAYEPLPHENYAGQYDFNGIRSVQQKIQIARQLGCGGVMIWDLPMDTGDPQYSLTINALAKTLVAQGQSPTTAEDTPVNLVLTATNSNPTNVSYSIMTGPAYGSLSGLNPATGTVTYTPAANFNGADSFTFRVFDGYVSSTATVSLTVTAVNDAPVAQNQSPGTPEDTPSNLVLTATDPDGAALAFAILTGPSSGTLSGFNPATGAVTYTPAANFNGSDSLTFEVSDGSLTSTGTVSLTVAPVNDAPVANNQNTGTNEDAPLALTLTASDVDGPALTYSIVSGPANGSLSGLNPTTGAVTYTPAANFNGADSFTFQASDGMLSATATVALTVASVNDAPVANNQNASTPQDTSLNLVLTGSDADGPALSYSILTGPANGSLSGLNPTTGAVTYQPNAGYYGADSFTFQVSDGSLSATGAVSLTVTQTLPPPTIALTSPTGGASFTLPTTINLAATVTANGNTIDKVQFFSNGSTLIGEDTSSPYTYNWTDATRGSHTLTARLVYNGTSTLDSAGANITILGLPTPWLTGDIGSGIAAGSASETNGLYTVSGAGNISGTADNFRFVYQTLSGDGEIKLRIPSFQSGTSARIGVMMRDTLTAGSKMAFMGVDGSGNYYSLRRTSTGGTTSSTASGSGTAPAVWVRLVRTGSSIVAYKSANGTSWTQVLKANLSMATNCYFGLSVASGSTGTLNTSTFDTLTVTP